MYLLAINCGSSSIKGKLYALPRSKSDPLMSAAALSVSNISSKGEKVSIKIQWEDGQQGKQDVKEEGEDGGSVEYKSLVPLLLKKLSEAGNLKQDDITYVTHRIVHGGLHKRGIRITQEHREGLDEMDKLSEFAPLHNHHAVLAVKSCLDALPKHTSFLVFDTLFHQTIPAAAYTYALPPANQDLVMPLRKYGFHGLSYASIVRSMAQHLGKPESDVNIVVAHLGSGASSCCIKGGRSIDTSMGLTPLEGLIGGTRSGTIDPTAIFHHTPHPEEDSGMEGIKVTKAEAILNKKSGLQALAGTTNFGLILSRLSEPSSCSTEEHDRAQLAYSVYLDRLQGYLSQYLCKLLSDTPLEQVDGIVFSGGIGERGMQLRQDVLAQYAWLGAKVDDAANEHAGKQTVQRITTADSKLAGWVVLTDEEGWCAQLTRDEFDF